MNIIWKGASELNHTKGRQGNSIDALVVHWIVGTLEVADKVFSDGRRKASAHYGVGDEDIHQYVKDEDTAWHCGDWLWNLKTIGIEHEGGPELPISDKTYETSAELIKELCSKYDIPIDKEHILPHNHFVATQCPGTLDIDRLISLATEDEIDCEKEIERLEDEIIEITAERDKKDRKLEECRDERTDLKNENQKIVENYDKQIKGLQNDLAGVRLELKDKTECITSLEEDKNALELNVGDLEDTLADNHQNYVDLEEKYQKCKEKIKDPVKNMSIFEFILHKLGR